MQSKPGRHGPLYAYRIRISGGKTNFTADSGHLDRFLKLEREIVVDNGSARG